jgi:hypothetical protein
MHRVLLFALALAACNGGSVDPVADGGTPDSAQPANCTFIDASACPGTAPSYANDVAPILDLRCNTTCHAPGVGPWPLTNYADVSDWADVIGPYVEQCGMPPPDSNAGDGNMTDAERQTVLDWLACGAPNN